MGALAVATLAALLSFSLACDGGQDRSHSKLERVLEQTGKTICDGDCKSFHATAATCAASGTLVGARRFYRCRISYDNGGRAETVCAALDGAEAMVRPLGTCKR